MVPFNGTAPATNALVGGQVDYLITGVSDLGAHIQAGTVKAYAIVKRTTGGDQQASEPSSSIRSDNYANSERLMLRWHGFSKCIHARFYEWRATIPEFSEALRIGKSLADERIKRSLYQRGIGYDLTAVKTEERLSDDGKFKVVKRTTSTEHVPGDVGAQKLWLVNRCPKEWREKVEVSHEVGPEMTAAEALDDMLVEHGVQVALPPPLIEGEAEEVETVGAARIAGRPPIARGRRRGMARGSPAA